MSSDSDTDESTYLVDDILKKCVLSNGKPCLACERQSKLRREIEVMEEKLDMLYVKEREARAEIIRYHGSDSILTVEERKAQKKMNPYHDPFHRFPPEVTSHIFCHTLPNFETFNPYLLQRSAEFALTLGAVCKAWRTIAWSTPRLWTKVILTLRGVPTRNKIAVVEEWIERSRRLSLTIRLRFSDYPNIPEEEDRQMFQMFVDVLNQHSPRWETLSLELPGWLCQLFKGNEKGAPLLKTLQISMEDLDEGSIFSLKGGKPQPKHVVIMNRRLDDIGICWDNVTNTTINEISLRNCIKLLHLAPKLVDVCFENVIDEVSDPPIAETPLVLHRLRTLNIHFDFFTSVHVPQTFYSPLFDLVTLPSLERLEVQSSVGEFIPFPANSVKGLLNRSSSPLTTFNLVRIKCDQQEALDILYALPTSVKYIKLNISLPRGQKDLDLSILFDHLARDPAVANGMPLRSEFLPNLETFEYHVFRTTHIPWGRLPNLLRPLSGKQRPFKKLTIINRDGKRRKFSLLAKGQELDESMIRDLIKFKEDGIDLFLPHKVTSEGLLALLEE